MPTWPLRRFRPRRITHVPVDPAEGERVSERLLPVAREVLAAPIGDGSEELLALVERLAPKHTEILCPSKCPPTVIARLLGQGFVVYDSSAVSRSSVLVLDRRLGWRLPQWEPLPHAFRAAARLLWTRLGYYTVQTGRVEAVHPDNCLFSLHGRTHWVNTAYRDLPLPRPGEELRVLGMFSFLGSTLPVLHAIQIERAADES